MSDDVCPCHGEPWAKNGPRRACRVKKAEAFARWKAAHPDQARKHRPTPDVRREQRRRNRERRKQRAQTAADS